MPWRQPALLSAPEDVESHEYRFASRLRRRTRAIGQTTEQIRAGVIDDMWRMTYRFLTAADCEIVEISKGKKA